MRNLIDIMDLSKAEINDMLDLADDITAHKEKYWESCKHMKLATLFFEPSTRTRLSFEAAMIELGGNVIGFSTADSSSAMKGETVEDTCRIVSQYVDIIAMRHPKEGAPVAAATTIEVPLINAGDGGHYHPTQTLTDLLTIRNEMGTMDDLTIGIVGDLKYGRTVHSLIKAMSRYKKIKFILISPKELEIPYYLKKWMNDENLEYIETNSLEEYMSEIDVLYMTRIQQERFFDINEYNRLKNSFILTPEKLIDAKKTMRILHPLPRVNEITREVDKDPRAAYFRQALNGKHIRMALILTLLKWAEEGR